MNSAGNVIKKRILALAVPVIVFCLIIWGKLLHISLAEGDQLRERSEKLIISERAIPAKRGDIYSADGKVLATSMPQYNIYADPVAPSQKDFDQYINPLAEKLSRLYPEKNARQWANYLSGQRMQGNRYVLIAGNQSYLQLQKVKELPLFKLGKFKGGLIYELEEYRKKPLAMAARTIGHSDNNAQAGIEGYFAAYLDGKDGKRLMQKIAGGHWKPLNDDNAREPVDGKDIYTTIDSKIQDIAQRALFNALTQYNAEHGSVIVMEVKSGHIKAIANLGKNERGNYVEHRNYAVWESTEPGSTFKIAALMVALEDGKIDTAKIVDTENGIYSIYDKKVKDSNVKDGTGGYGKISVADAIRKSSNTGIVKAIYPAYKNNEQQFIDRLYQMGLHQPTGITIGGETAPKIPKPGDKSWSGLTLPWMIFGYEVSFTPLQMLTFYNAIANDGVMVKPQIVTEVRQHGRVIESFGTTTLNNAICSQQTIKQLQALLEGAVSNGTAKNIYSPELPIAGKTGTCQLNYWITSYEYQASFAGYFPANDPKYSCIVVIHKPEYARGYYGNIVAAPVFKTIAEELVLAMPAPVNQEIKGGLTWKTNQTGKKEEALQHNYLPNLKGLTAMDAISLLENYGLKVKVSGSGRVVGQHPPVGTALSKNMTIELTLG